MRCAVSNVTVSSPHEEPIAEPARQPGGQDLPARHGGRVFAPVKGHFASRLVVDPEAAPRVAIARLPHRARIHEVAPPRLEADDRPPRTRTSQGPRPVEDEGPRVVAVPEEADFEVQPLEAALGLVLLEQV